MIGGDGINDESNKMSPAPIGIPTKPKNRNIEKLKSVKTGIKRNRPHASKRYNIHNDNT